MSTPTQPILTGTHSSASKQAQHVGQFFPAFWEKLDRSKIVRYILYILIFSCILLLNYNSVVFPGNVKDNLTEVKNLFIFSLSFYITLLVAFNVLSSKIALTSNRSMCLIWSAILLQLTCIEFISHFCIDRDNGTSLIFLTIPYGLAPMISSVLLGRRVGIFTVLACSLYGGVLVPRTFSVEILAISLIAGSVVVLTTNGARKRSQLLRAGCYTGLVVLSMCLLFNKIDFFGWSIADLKAFTLQAILAFSVSLMIAIFLSGIFPILESIFGIITPTSWLELSDMNHSLLRRMQLEAPGTFHHSLAVAQLAETAAESIGANALKCRVCAYFHDLGKLKNPNFFIENIAPGESPHDNLPPKTSAQIITQHVRDGVELATQNKLNKHIISAIREHHGTSLVYFFYRKALDIRDALMEKVEKGLMNPEDVEHPVQSDYTYDGPRPQSKENGIVSLADIVESAARSLKQPTMDDIRELVDRLIRARVVDGQLNDSRLTLGELNTIKESFVSSLKNMMHSRISYPKEKEETPTKTPTQPIKTPIPKTEDTDTHDDPTDADKEPDTTVPDSVTPETETKD